MPSTKKAAPVQENEDVFATTGIEEDVLGDTPQALVIELPVDIADLMEQSKEPPLKPGDYHAYIVGIAMKENPTTGSVGLNITYGISKSGLNMDGPFITITDYLWMGTRGDDGRIRSVSKVGKPVQNFSLANFISCFFENTGNMTSPDDFIGRILKLKIVWEVPTINNDEGRTYLSVAGFRPVIEAGVRGPVFTAAKL